MSGFWVFGLFLSKVFLMKLNIKGYLSLGAILEKLDPNSARKTTQNNCICLGWHNQMDWKFNLDSNKRWIKKVLYHVINFKVRYK